MVDNRRWPRVRQSGVDCSVVGCTNDCVSNDLCAKHSMRLHRLTEKGKAYVRRYNKQYKRPEIDKTCIRCKKSFVTARKTQELCSECSPEFSVLYALRKFRAKQAAKVG